MFAKRMEYLESSTIRKMFELAAKMKDPIDLSLGQADFQPPAAAVRAASEAIENGINGYSTTAGMPELRSEVEKLMRAEGVDPQSVMIVCGAEGALMLSVLALADEGCEVLLADPCFATYGHLVKLAGAGIRHIDTYPDFRITPERLRSSCTPKTKVFLFNSPVNPTGVAYTPDEIKAIAETAAELGLRVISDEVYDKFCYDYKHECFAKYDKNALVIRAFSKMWGAAGWRLGFAFGPKDLIGHMTTLQQFTFICAPAPFQYAASRAIDSDISSHIANYKRRRDYVFEKLSRAFEMHKPEGTFYAFCKAPKGDADGFIKKCLENELLVVPGKAFSKRNTHFRISYAVDDKKLERGIELLVKLAK